jgi:hypothetical protein
LYTRERQNRGKRKRKQEAESVSVNRNARIYRENARICTHGRGGYSKPKERRLKAPQIW